MESDEKLPTKKVKEMYEGRNLKLEGLNLFGYLLGRNTPHEAVNIMIDNNQDMKEVRKYLQAMINHINEEDLNKERGDYNV